MKRPSNFYWTASLCLGVASLPRRQAGLPDGKAGLPLSARQVSDFVPIKITPPPWGPRTQLRLNYSPPPWEGVGGRSISRRFIIPPLLP